VEVVEGHEEEGSDEEVDEGPASADLALVDHPQVARNAARLLVGCLHLAVIFAYFFTGNTFMKLRLNINYYYYNTTPSVI
jgi:hypothetical protein